MDTSAHNKHHGLNNHGATCYLNSVLQVLFMTKDFREAVQRLTNGNPDFIDLQLKDVFDDLLERTTYTYKILESLHIDRVYEQRDAAEYLQKLLGRTSPEAAKTFHGELTSSISCSLCGKKTSSDGQFWHLPLPLVDSYNSDYSVVKGLAEFFKTSRLNRENQMYCDQCDTKVDATRETIVKLHPDVLILLLKRFDFSYQYMSYVKINSDVDVPYTVEIPENKKYELYAVVNHVGDLRSGHYTAAIKDQDEDRWYDFNDTIVTPYDRQLFLDNEKLVKSSSAYLLFYRKKDTAAKEGMVLTNGGSATSTCESHNESHDAETDRMQEQSEVSVDNDDDVLSNRTSPEHNLKPHGPEIRVEPVEPALSDCSPHSHAGEQESNEEILKDDQKRHDNVQTEHRSLLPNVAQHEGNDSENPEPVELNEMKPGVSHDLTVYTSNAVSKETYDNDKLNEPLSRCAGHQHDKESSNVENIHEYHCGHQNDGRNDGIKPVDAANVGDEERMKADINKDNMEERTDSNKTISPQKLLTKYDLCYSLHLMDHKQQDIPEDDQKHEKGKQEKGDEGRVDVRVSDHDAGQNKFGQRDDVTHEMQSNEGVEKHNEMRDNEEKADSSYAQQPGSQGRENLPLSQVSENDEIEMSKQATSREMQEVSDGCQSSKQPGDDGTIADCSSETTSGGHEKCRTKRVTDEQTEAAGIKHTLKKRSLKHKKYLGYSGQPRPAPYRKGKD